MLTLRISDGRAAGQLELPAPLDDLKRQLEMIRAESQTNDIPTVQNIDCPVPSLGWHLQRTRLDSDPTLQRLNQLAEVIDGMNTAGRCHLSKSLSGEFRQSLEDVLQIAVHIKPDSIDRYEVIPGVSTHQELGKWLVEHDHLEARAPEILRPYLDYRSIGIDYCNAHDGEFLADGYAGIRTGAMEQGLDEQGVLRLTLVTTGQSRPLDLPASDERLEQIRSLLGLEDFAEAIIRDVKFSAPQLNAILPLDAITVEDANTLALCLQEMEQEDGALMKYCAVLEVEKPNTFAEALNIAMDRGDYELVPEDMDEYGKQVLRRTGADDEIIDTIDGYMDFARLGADSMEEDGVRRTEFGLVRRLSEPFPPQHVIDSTPQQVELHAGDGIKSLTFYNDKKPGIHLIKVDADDPSKVIPNAKFTIRSVAGDYGPEEFTTNEQGIIDLSKLPLGAYEVREISCPGYIIDEEQRIIQLDGNETAEFVFTNHIKPSIRVIKKSSDGSPLGGVHFRIAKIEDGTRYLDRITNDQGEILISDLEPGVYSVKETATTSNHIIDVREYHVELFPGKTSEITIENQKRPNLIVYKHDADTGAPIPDTVFLVKAADGHSVDEIKTDSNGRAELKNLLPGVYEVSEKTVPAPWLQDAPAQMVTLYPNRDHTLYFKNHKKPTLAVNKVDSVTGSPIKGAKFEVWYGSNNTTTGELNSLGTYFSDANGQFKLELLRDGWYKVTELEPAAGFTIKEPATQEVYIKGGENKVLTFENVPLNAIAVEKYDSVTGEALPGCTFQLRYLAGASGTGGNVIGTKVTGKNGTALWTGLKPGTYILEEVDPADGYSIIQSSETILLADNGEQSVVTIRFTNAPDGMLLIRKVCSVNPSVTLQDAEFKIIYADGSVIGDSNGIYRTDENGEIRITGLKPGKSVVVTETRAPAGFILDTQSQTVQVARFVP